MGSYVAPCSPSPTRAPRCSTASTRRSRRPTFVSLADVTSPGVVVVVGSMFLQHVQNFIVKEGGGHDELLRDEALVIRSYRMRMYYRFGHRRDMGETAFHVDDGNRASLDRMVGASFLGIFAACVIFRWLYAGLKVLAALKRNVLEGRTRGHIVQRMMLHVLGTHGPARLLELLPYMNHYTWHNQRYFGAQYGPNVWCYHHHKPKLRNNQIVLYEAGWVLPARNVRRRVAS